MLGFFISYKVWQVVQHWDLGFFIDLSVAQPQSDMLQENHYYYVAAGEETEGKRK